MTPRDIIYEALTNIENNQLLFRESVDVCCKHNDNEILIYGDDNQRNGAAFRNKVYRITVTEVASGT